MRWFALAGGLLIACGGGGGGGDDADAPPGGGDGPPSGAGISGDYPGDVGIGGDPRVVFADDFESYGGTAELSTRWDEIYQQAQLRLARETDNFYAGAQAIEMTAPAQDAELSNALGKVLDSELDVLYLRFYSRFESNNDIVGSSHNGADISGGYFVDGNATPGVPADGTNKFLIAYESWRGEPATTAPGELNIYIYHPEQRTEYGDHFFPNGDVMPNTSIPGNFGPTFVPRPNITVELGRWYAYEVMLRANTPGERDGRVTCWLDGEIIADFPNLRLRDIDTLKIDRFAITFHFRSSPSVTRKWYDNVVAATEYIGPMVR